LEVKVIVTKSNGKISFAMRNTLVT